MSEWLRIATERNVVLRALGYAVGVGAVLIAINHGDAILAGDLGPERWIKIGLTLCVPYLVSTFSSTAAIRAARAAPGSSGE